MVIDVDKKVVSSKYIFTDYVIFESIGTGRLNFTKCALILGLEMFWGISVEVLLW